MVFLSKSSSNTSKTNNNNEGWGMGFLLILFHHNPDDDNPNHHHHQISKRKCSLSLSSSFAAKSTNLLLSKTQSTLSICGLLVFTTLLLFTLSTFEPTSVLHHHSSPSRRFLQQTKNSKNTLNGFSVPTLFPQISRGSESNFTTRIAPPALQGMGALYLRGTKAMTDLIVGHVPEDTTMVEITTFFRGLQFSGILSRSDFVFVFASPLMASTFGPVVKRECERLLRLVQLCKLTESIRLSYALGRYSRGVGEGNKEPMWGKKRGNVTELNRSSYGSVVGFEVSELDPEDSLSGFLDHVPMGFRRWASYPMLLGRVRRQFKHTLLLNVKSTLVLSDPFARVRNHSSESLFLWSNPDPEPRRRGKRNSDKNSQEHAGMIRPAYPDLKQAHTHYNTEVIVGGSRGVRRFAAAVQTEIVRAVVERKGKRGRNPVTELGLVNQLVHSGHLLRSINLITPTEPVPELSSLGGLNSGEPGTSELKLTEYFSVVQRGHSNGGSGSFDIDTAVMKEICASHKLYSSVYSDCLVSQ